MSATFDPSNFNLDPNSPEEKNDITPEEKTNPSKQEDILGEIKIPENSSEISDIITHTVNETENSKTKKTIVIDSKLGDILDEIEDNTQDNENEILEEKEEVEEKQKIIDINIASLESIVTLIESKQYEFIIIEPEDTQVKITFKQDNIDKDIRYIKFPIYTSILFKIKQITSLTVEDTENPQEGKGKIKVGSKTFKLSSKTAPGQNGERIWLKSVEDLSEKGKKTVKKTSLSAIFGFLGAILFVSLVLGSAFIAFIVMNANDVQDVQFFIDLGININDVNTFISKMVNIIFFILIFISSCALSFALFKFFLTKKSLRKKKISYGLLSGLLLIITFGIGISWMAIDQRIKSLPNWQEKIYGNLKIFDNDLLISEDFNESQAILTETQDLIGPVTLKFDLNNYQESQARKSIEINKYIWNFGGEIIETFTPEVTKTFEDKGNYEILVTTVGIDINGDEIEQSISNIPTVSISHKVEIIERTTNNGGKRLELDATDLENLGRIKWYFKTPQTEDNFDVPYPEWTHEEDAEGYTFFPRKIFREDVFVGVSIINGSTVDETINKVFVILADKASEISGDIDYTQSLEDELTFTFKVTDTSTSFGNGFIDTYEWTIEDKTYTSRAEIGETNSSPEIEHTFKKYGPQEVQVLLTNTAGKSELLTRTIEIQKKVALRDSLFITDDSGNELKDIRYEEKTNEYFIDDLGIPTELKLDTRYVKPVNGLYSLTDVSWDRDNDGNTDGNDKTYIFDIPTEGNHILAVNYTFTHRRNKDDVITLKEFVFVQGIKKEAILDLQLEYDSNYAPVVVRFDASKSFIKNDDIIKFIYDYGNGVVEERDAINPGHRYSEEGDYTIKLTVVGKTGRRYSIEKDLILLPPAQTIKVSSSLKRAPILQGIDFSSAESAGQIVEYFWDFGDGNISTLANPTHSYKKAGTYEVKLRADFANSNIKEDIIEVEIFEP